MKKIISIFVAMMMIVSMFTVSAFAEAVGGADDPSGSSTADVNIAISGQAAHKYSVDVTFAGLNFTYATGGTWNPSSHQYDYAEGGSWTSDSDTITITNHSDQIITYAADCEEVTTYGTLTVKFADDNGNSSAVASISATNLAACKVGAEGGVPTATITVSVEGTPTVSTMESTKLGTVTITIAKGA